MPQPVSRRSSIVYIKSPGENGRPEFVTVSTDCVDDPMDSTQWPTRAVKPLIPKSSKLQCKLSSSEAPSSSPGGGLRPLSLLRDRNTNKDSGDNVVSSKSAGTRPLLLGKKKPKVKVTGSDENVDSTGSANKYLKPLQIHRRLRHASSASPIHTRLQFPAEGNKSDGERDVPVFGAEIERRSEGAQISQALSLYLTYSLEGSTSSLLRQQNHYSGIVLATSAGTHPLLLRGPPSPPPHSFRCSIYAFLQVRFTPTESSPSQLGLTYFFCQPHPHLASVSS